MLTKGFLRAQGFWRWHGENLVGFIASTLPKFNAHFLSSFLLSSFYFIFHEIVQFFIRSSPCWYFGHQRTVALSGQWRTWSAHCDAKVRCKAGIGCVTCTSVTWMQKKWIRPFSWIGRSTQLVAQRESLRLSIIPSKNCWLFYYLLLLTWKSK